MSAAIQNIGNATDLPALAASIREEIGRAHEHARSAVEHARRAGELLQEAKDSLSPGAWCSWLAANVSVSHSTVASYMRLAKRMSCMPEKHLQRVASLPLRLALREIAGPGRSPARRAEGESAPPSIFVLLRRELEEQERDALAALSGPGRRHVIEALLRTLRDELQPDVIARHAVEDEAELRRLLDGFGAETQA